MLPAEPGGHPLLDLVIVIDSSPSMKDTAQQFSQAAPEALVAAQTHCPAERRLAWFGLEGTRRGTLFTTTLRLYLTQRCHKPADTLRSRRRGTVPGGTAQADGARAMEDIALHFDWRPGAQRAMLWIGDKGLEGGGNLVDTEDVEAANQAIAVAQAAGLLVHTYIGTSRSRSWDALAAEYARVAQETGGRAFRGVKGLDNSLAVLERLLCTTRHDEALLSTTFSAPEERPSPATQEEPAQTTPTPALLDSLAIARLPQRDEDDATSAHAAHTQHAARAREAVALVKNHVIGAMAVGAFPFPVIDTVAVAALQLRMIARLSHVYDVPFSQHTARSIVVALLGGLTPVMARQVGLSLLKFVPLLGSSVGTIATTTSAGATTYAVGLAFMRHFEHGHSFLTLKREDMKRDVQHFMGKGHAVATALQPETQAPQHQEVASGVKVA